MDEESPILDYLDTPRTFEAFRDFFVREGLTISPELAQYDAAIAAMERGVLSARRAFYTPVVGLQGEITRRFARGGAGAKGPKFPVSLLASSPEETVWNVGIEASLPLYAGGARKAARLRAEQQCDRLRIERAATSEKIEQWIRTATLAARASKASIEQTRLAAAAAEKNLALVSDAYTRGALSILELLDAQTAFRVADQLAANAVYDFLLDVMEAQRASGGFECLMMPEEMHLWLQKMQEVLSRSR